MERAELERLSEMKDTLSDICHVNDDILKEIEEILYPEFVGTLHKEVNNKYEELYKSFQVLPMRVECNKIKLRLIKENNELQRNSSVVDVRPGIKMAIKLAIKCLLLRKIIKINLDNYKQNQRLGDIYDCIPINLIESDISDYHGNIQQSDITEEYRPFNIEVCRAILTRKSGGSRKLTSRKRRSKGKHGLYKRLRSRRLRH